MLGEAEAAAVQRKWRRQELLLAALPADPFAGDAQKEERAESDDAWPGEAEELQGAAEEEAVRYELAWCLKKGRRKKAQFWVYCEEGQANYCSMRVTGGGHFRWSQVSTVQALASDPAALLLVEDIKASGQVRGLRLAAGRAPQEMVAERRQLLPVHSAEFRLVVTLEADDSLPMHPRQGKAERIVVHEQMVQPHPELSAPFGFSCKLVYRNREDGWFRLRVALRYRDCSLIEGRSDVFMFNNPRIRKQPLVAFTPHQVKFMQAFVLEPEADQTLFVALGLHLGFPLLQVFEMMANARHLVAPRRKKDQRSGSSGTDGSRTSRGRLKPPQLPMAPATLPPHMQGLVLQSHARAMAAQAAAAAATAVTGQSLPLGPRQPYPPAASGDRTDALGAGRHLQGALEAQNGPPDLTGSAASHAHNDQAGAGESGDAALQILHLLPMETRETGQPVSSQQVSDQQVSGQPLSGQPLAQAPRPGRRPAGVGVKRTAEYVGGREGKMAATAEGPARVLPFQWLDGDRLARDCYWIVYAQPWMSHQSLLDLISAKTAISGVQVPAGPLQIYCLTAAGQVAPLVLASDAAADTAVLVRAQAGAPPPPAALFLPK